jgi:hypothetical protein
MRNTVAKKRAGQAEVDSGCLFANFLGSATRPRQREALTEFLRKGEVDEAVRAFKKIYLEVVHRMLENREYVLEEVELLVACRSPEIVSVP